MESNIKRAYIQASMVICIINILVGDTKINYFSLHHWKQITIKPHFCCNSKTSLQAPWSNKVVTVKFIKKYLSPLKFVEFFINLLKSVSSYQEKRNINQNLFSCEQNNPGLTAQSVSVLNLRISILTKTRRTIRTVKGIFIPKTVQ